MNLGMTEGLVTDTSMMRQYTYYVPHPQCYRLPVFTEWVCEVESSSSSMKDCKEAAMKMMYTWYSAFIPRIKARVPEMTEVSQERGRAFTIIGLLSNNEGVFGGNEEFRVLLQCVRAQNNSAATSCRGDRYSPFIHLGQRHDCFLLHTQ